MAHTPWDILKTQSFLWKWRHKRSHPGAWPVTLRWIMLWGHIYSLILVNNCNVTIDHSKDIQPTPSSNGWAHNTRLNITCEELREAKPSSFILRCLKDGAIYKSTSKAEIPDCQSKNARYYFHRPSLPYYNRVKKTCGNCRVGSFLTPKIIRSH